MFDALGEPVLVENIGVVGKDPSSPATIAEDFRKGEGGGFEGCPVATGNDGHPRDGSVIGGDQPREEGADRWLGPARTGEGVFKNHALFGEGVEAGGGRAGVSQKTAVIGSQGIDDHDHDVWGPRRGGRLSKVGDRGREPMGRQEKKAQNPRAAEESDSPSDCGAGTTSYPFAGPA